MKYRKEMIACLLPVLSVLYIKGQTFENKNEKPVVSATMMNILYQGHWNPVDIAVPNYSCNALLVSITNGIIKGKECEYYVIPGKIGKSIIKVMTILKKDTILLGEAEFRVKKFPLELIFCNRRGIISNENVLDCLNTEIRLMTEFHIEPPFRITQFDLVINKAIHLTSTQNKLTSEMKDALVKIRSGDIIKFEKIKAVALDVDTNYIVVDIDTAEFKVE